jgi:hypothetical protein
MEFPALSINILSEVLGVQPKCKKWPEIDSNYLKDSRFCQVWAVPRK